MALSKLFVVSIAVLALLGAALSAQQAETTLARQAADTWLSLVDAANYAGSWIIAATHFKNAVSVEDWAAAAQVARGPLGAMRTREERSATPVTTLPSAPDGEHVVFQFDTAFQNKALAVETVTFVRDADGLWRAVGYFVR